MRHTAVLPKGWAATELGQIRVDLSRALDPRQYPDEDFELYSVPSFADGEPEIVRGSAIGSTKMTLTPGTVVVCKINPRISRVWVVGDRSRHKKIGSGEWIPFFPVDGVTPHFLAYYLRRDHFRNFLAARVSGVGGSLMRVRPTTLGEYPLPIPSVSEQQRIVEAIESYLTRLDDAIASLERVQRNLERYRASVLKAAVEGRLVPTEAELARREERDYEPAGELLKRILAERKRRWIEDAAEKARAKAEEKARRAGKPWTPDDDARTLQKARRDAEGKYEEPTPPDTTDLPDLPEGWCWATVEQFAEHRLGKMLDKAKNRGSLLPYLRNANVRWFGFETDSLAQMRVEGAELPSVSVEAGDLVICEGGEPGRCAVWQAREPAVIQKALHRVRPHPRIVSWYLAFHLGADALSRRLDEAFTGTTIKHFTGEALRAYAFALPPTAEQQRITDAVHGALTMVDRMSRVIGGMSIRADHLKQSILRWAFEGKLVEQDPNDLPAPRPGRFFVYGLECSDGSIYIGQTHNILERWKQHASGRGADWTRRHPPRRLVHWEEFDSLEEAVSREKDLKTGFGRKWLRREIEAGRTRQAGEPASVLLERIKAEREKATARGKGGKRRCRS